MSLAEFAEWIAYYSIEPFGEQRSDLRAGIIASTFANTHRDKKRKPFAPADFMPYMKTAKPKARELWNKMKAALKPGNQ